MRTDTSRWALLLVPLLATAGCGGDDAEPITDRPSGQAPPVATDTAGSMGTDAPAGSDRIEQGRQVFAGNGLCFSCHGADGAGTPLGPNLVDGDWIWLDPAAGDTLTQVATIVRTGVSAPEEHPAPMPAMGGAQLSEDQIQAVSEYVLSLNTGG